MFNSNSNIFRNVTANTNSVSSYGIDISQSDNNTFYDMVINTNSASDIFLEGTLQKNDNYIINSVFNKSDIGVSSTSVSTKLYVLDYLDVLVQQTSGVPISSAIVEGNDTVLISDSENPTANFITSTDSTGHTPRLILTEFMVNGTYGPSANYLYFSNYTIKASSPSSFTNSKNFNLTSNDFETISLTLIPPPPSGQPFLTWYEIPTLIEINQSLSKTNCFIIANLGDNPANNVSIYIRGISSLWFNANPTLFSTLNPKSNQTVCMTINIPALATPSDYTVVMNASDSVSAFGNFILRVNVNDTARTEAQQALQRANAKINETEIAGKNVTDAKQLYYIAIVYYNQQQYDLAKQYADKAYNEAEKTSQSTGPINTPYNFLLYAIVGSFVPLIIIFSIFYFKGRGPKDKFEKLKEKWTESMKGKFNR